MGKRSAPDSDGASQDVALVVGRTEDAEGYRVLRHRPEQGVEMGTMRPLKEGRPIDGEIISLQAREDAPFLYNVKTELADPRAQERRGTSAGPAQIATEDYRNGWDAIWGTPKPSALN